MGLFFKSDGLKSYYLNGDFVSQATHTTAFRASGATTITNTNSLFGNDGSYSDSIFLSSDGTKLYILYTDYAVSTANQGYLRQYALSTAWLLSSLNTTPTTTTTLPLGTEYSIYSGKSAKQKWSGLEFAPDGLSFHFVRYENNNVSGATQQSVTFKVNYTLSTAWSLSSASLSSTTKIDYASVTGYGGMCLGYHTMSGGEIILSMGGNFIELSSITDTTANSISSLASTGFFFSTDETLLLQNGANTCGIVHTEIDTNYSSSSLTSFSSSESSKFQSTACGFSMNQTYYHDGTGIIPKVGDIVYSDSEGTLPLSKWYYRNGGATFEIEVPGFGQPNTGEVVAIDICI
jgi:hypothetical protein